MEDWTPRELAGAEPPAAPLPLWRRLPIGWLVFGALVLGGGATSWFFGASRSDSGEIAKTGDMNAVDLRVGDCFDFKDPNAEELEDVTAMPCAQEHEHELIFTGSMPAGAYPGGCRLRRLRHRQLRPGLQGIHRDGVRSVDARDQLARSDGGCLARRGPVDPVCRLGPAGHPADGLVEGLEPVGESHPSPPGAPMMSLGEGWRDHHDAATG